MSGKEGTLQEEIQGVEEVPPGAGITGAMQRRPRILDEKRRKRSIG